MICRSSEAERDGDCRGKPFEDAYCFFLTIIKRTYILVALPCIQAINYVASFGLTTASRYPYNPNYQASGQCNDAILNSTQPGLEVQLSRQAILVQPQNSRAALMQVICGTVES